MPRGKRTKTGITFSIRFNAMKACILVLLICSLGSSTASAQGLYSDSTIQPFRIVEEMPKYLGGERRMYRFLGENIHYPATALSDSIEGTVYTQFVIDERGDVVNIEVIRGVRDDLNTAAINVVKMMPRWKPGRQRGKPVPVFYNLPIRFSLN